MYTSRKWKCFVTRVSLIAATYLSWEILPASPSRQRVTYLVAGEQAMPFFPRIGFDAGTFST